jgi:pyroglutamyl-peptidase
MDKNPSGMLAQALDGSEFSGFTVTGAELPVDCAQMPVRLYSLLEKIQPKAIIGLGLAFGRTAISLERIGINLLDFKADSAGNGQCDQPIIESGQAAYFSTLPLRAIEKELLSVGIPCYLSESAGLYLCNQLLYTSLHYATTHRHITRVGFIHLPALPEMVTETTAAHQPSMNFETQLAGINHVLSCVAAFLEK